MIEVKNLSKRYGDKLAVDDLDFTVQPGMVTGFLGPNGAGKSTTMRMIAGLDRPTSGSVLVNGQDYRHAPAPMGELGLLLEAKAIHTGRSARNHLLALAQTNGIGRRRVDEVIDMVGLTDVAEQAGRRLLARHGAAARHRLGAARRPQGRRPRRAGQRPRPRGRAVDPHPAQVPRRRGPHRLRLQPPDERDGGHREPAGRHRPRPADRRHHGRAVPRRREGQQRPGPHPRDRASCESCCSARTSRSPRPRPGCCRCRG